MDALISTLAHSQVESPVGSHTTNSDSTGLNIIATDPLGPGSGVKDSPLSQIAAGEASAPLAAALESPLSLPVLHCKQT